jgi:hypothetical protein
VDVTTPVLGPLAFRDPWRDCHLVCRSSNNRLDLHAVCIATGISELPSFCIMRSWQHRTQHEAELLALFITSQLHCSLVANHRQPPAIETGGVCCHIRLHAIVGEAPGCKRDVERHLQ